MNANRKRKPSTAIFDAQFDECLKIAIRYLQTNPRITNKDIRKAAAIGYDQAIRFFNRAITEGVLVRKGSSSGTYYVLPSEGEDA